MSTDNLKRQPTPLPQPRDLAAELVDRGDGWHVSPGLLAGSFAILVMGLVSGRPSPFDGQWLVEYDPTRPGRAPDGKPMTAHIVCSPHRSSARRFKDPAEAHAYWCLKSGRPAPADMPLTAFTIAIEQVV